MADETRRVFQFDPTNPTGFSEMDITAPIVSKQTSQSEPQNSQTTEPTPPTPPESETASVNDTEGGDAPQVETQSEPEAQTQELPTSDQAEPETLVNTEGEPVNTEPQGADTEGQEEDQDAPQAQEVLTDNFYVAAANAMKERGELPEDFQLDGELTEEEASNKIYEAYQGSLRKDAHKELYNEFQSELTKRGWNEETLQYAHLLHSGVNPADIARSVSYNDLYQADTGSFSDDDKSNYIRQMYVDRGWKEKEIKRILDSVEVDGDYDSLVEESKSYFQSKKEQVDKSNAEKAQIQQQQKQQLETYKNAVVAEIFNKREIGGERLSEDQLDQLESALYETSIPLQHNGQIYNITPYEQFEMALNNDFGLKMYLFKKYLFKGSEMKQLEAEAMKKAEDAQLIKWGKRAGKVRKTETSTEPQPVKSTREPMMTVPKGSKSYIMDDGHFKQL